ncbi:MAG: hypothetical protein ACRBBR_15490 [Cellvibrionaceae bacterium]
MLEIQQYFAAQTDKKDLQYKNKRMIDKRQRLDYDSEYYFNKNKCG